jgi:hypothetical protein
MKCVSVSSSPTSEPMTPFPPLCWLLMLCGGGVCIPSQRERDHAFLVGNQVFLSELLEAGSYEAVRLSSPYFSLTSSNSSLMRESIIFSLFNKARGLDEFAFFSKLVGYLSFFERGKSVKFHFGNSLRLKLGEPEFLDEVRLNVGFVLDFLTVATTHR